MAENTKFNCGDCGGVCRDRACHYLRELEDGRVVAVSCYGKCDGRCVGTCVQPGFLSPAYDGGAAPRPDGRSRLTVRSKELYWEKNEGDAGGDDGTSVSCVVGCIVGHRFEGSDGAADCYGTCLGLCYGRARVEELTPAASRPERH